MYHAEGFGEPQLEGSSCSSRACETSFGKLREELRVFDIHSYTLAYEVVEGFPAFVKKGVNHWQLRETGPQETEVKIHFIAQTPGLIGAIMGTMMKMQLGGALGGILEEFKYYVEAGEAHPRKVADQQKYAKKHLGRVLA